MELEILPDPEAVARRAADWMTAIARATDGPVSIALSGGSTPRLLYETLASAPWRKVFPWAQCHWFWGDERFVPPDDPLSNFRTAWEAMLQYVPISAGAIHAIPTVGLTPLEAANAYGRELAACYGADRLDVARPLFDIILLGLGTDGHTASLFPSTAALEKRKHWVAAVTDAEGKARITLTYPVLESSGHTAFLVEGRDKRAILRRLMSGDGDFPAARLRPQGELRLFADQTATGDRTRTI